MLGGIVSEYFAPGGKGLTPLTQPEAHIQREKFVAKSFKGRPLESTHSPASNPQPSTCNLQLATIPQNSHISGLSACHTF